MDEQAARSSMPIFKRLMRTISSTFTYLSTRPPGDEERSHELVKDYPTIAVDATEVWLQK